MVIFDEIEKLINEHGSAKILRERIAFAKDQHTAQEKRIAELSLQLEQSEKEKTALSSQLQRSQDKNNKLTQQIDEFHRKPPLKFIAPFYFVEGDEVPFCPACWESEKIQIHLPAPSKTGEGPCYKCHKCGREIIHPHIEARSSKGFGA